MNAMRLPSGDQLGNRSHISESPRLIHPEPSKFTTPSERYPARIPPYPSSEIRPSPFENAMRPEGGSMIVGAVGVGVGEDASAFVAPEDPVATVAFLCTTADPVCAIPGLVPPPSESDPVKTVSTIARINPTTAAAASLKTKLATENTPIDATTGRQRRSSHSIIELEIPGDSPVLPGPGPSGSTRIQSTALPGSTSQTRHAPELTRYQVACDEARRSCMSPSRPHATGAPPTR